MFTAQKIPLIITTGLFAVSVLNCIAAEDSNTILANKKIIDPFKQNEHLGRGINLGNALDGPNEGEWGVTLKEEYFKIIKDAGFDSVRIPIRWSNHAMKEVPYTIDEPFFKRVDWAIDNAIKNNLYAIINVHHYIEIMQDPNGHTERLLAFWEQIAKRYKDCPDSVLFELLNEPHTALTLQLWNNLLKKAIAVIRKSNPNRTIIAGPGEYNIIGNLDKLELPTEDRNIIVSFHYYAPHQFTHQNAMWMPEAKEWAGTRWTGTDQQKKTITDDFDKIAKWGKQNNRPINLGEFGVYKDAEKSDRMLWTTFVAESAVNHGFSFHYWEFCHEFFGAYDQPTKQWKEYLLNALIPPKR